MIASIVSSLAQGLTTLIKAIPPDVLARVATAIIAVVAALKLWAIAQAALNLVIDANPISLIILAIAGLIAGFVELWNHSAAFRDFWKTLWSDIQKIMAPVVSWIQNVIKDMERWWHDHGETVLKILQTAWIAITTLFKINLALVEGYIKVGLTVIEAVWRTVWDAVKTVVVTTWDVIKTAIQTAVKIVQDIINAGLALIQGHWHTAWSDLVNAASAGMKGIVTIITTIAKGFITLLYNAGRDIIQGLINGIKSMIGAIGGVISDIGHGISSAFGSVMKIFSPSQVFYQHGVNTMLGYINGLRDMAPAVKTAMRQVAEIMLPPQGGSAWPASSASAPFASLLGSGGGGGASGSGSSGSVIVNVDGKKLFEVMQDQLYRYNVRNSGQITGVVKPN